MGIPTLLYNNEGCWGGAPEDRQDQDLSRFGCELGMKTGVELVLEMKAKGRREKKKEAGNGHPHPFIQ
jgi:hypothetical protein